MECSQEEIDRCFDIPSDICRWVLRFFPDTKVHGANMDPISGRQDQGGPHVGHVILAV